LALVEKLPIVLLCLHDNIMTPYLLIYVWNIARRNYGADTFLLSNNKSATKEAKSLTPTIYKQIGELFRSRFPSYSGWALSLLFVAEMPRFRPLDLVK
jgi:hypothetical protein